MKLIYQIGIHLFICERLSAQWWHAEYFRLSMIIPTTKCRAKHHICVHDFIVKPSKIVESIKTGFRNSILSSSCCGDFFFIVSTTTQILFIHETIIDLDMKPVNKYFTLTIIPRFEDCHSPINWFGIGLKLFLFFSFYASNSSTLFFLFLNILVITISSSSSRLVLLRYYLFLRRFTVNKLTISFSMFVNVSFNLVLFVQISFLEINMWLVIMLIDSLLQ